MTAIHHFRDQFFKQIHTSNLVYNTCWEDPRCDRQLLQINEESKLCMITSAGCNALDYLLDNPKEIHCVDMNPRQNALLNLKKSAFKETEHPILFELFGEGNTIDFKHLLNKYLSRSLTENDLQYWQQKANYFVADKNKGSFYFHGTSGLIAWWFKNFLSLTPTLKADLKKIFSSTSLEEQKEKYVGIERKIFSPFFQWLTSRHTVLTMAGVPRAQRNLIQADNPGGVKSFILNSLKHVFTKIPLQDNYFWHVYLFGKYTRDCCPNYLKPENFEPLKKTVNKISTYSQTITSFLTENPGTYSHFILLDHLDWLAYHNPEAMREEWEIMLKNSAPGTKFLLRSAATHLHFIPDFVHDAIDFSNNETLIQHNLDRVGTYGSVHLGIVK